MRGRPVIIFLCFVGLCLAAGAVGSLFTAGAVKGWYTTIQKPSWNPPNWTFAVVWTILYIMMGVAAALVWLSSRGPRRLAMFVFFVQLVLNAAWTPVFFGLQSIGGGLAIIAALWAAVLLAAVLFWRVRAAAGALLLPYLAWVSFAGVLNWTIWRLNS